MSRMALQRTLAFTIGTVPNPTDPPAETRRPRPVPHSPSHPGTSEAMSRLAFQRIQVLHDRDCPHSPANPSDETSSPHLVPHPSPTQERAERRSGCRSRESRAVTIGTVPNPTDLSAEPTLLRPVPHSPTRRGTSEAMSRLAPQRTTDLHDRDCSHSPANPSDETSSPHLVPHPLLAQGRAEQRPGWRSRGPSPSRLGLPPQRSPPPSSDRAPIEERAGVGAGAVRRRRRGQAPWRRDRTVSAGILAREGDRVGGG